MEALIKIKEPSARDFQCWSRASRVDYADESVDVLFDFDITNVQKGNYYPELDAVKLLYKDEKGMRIIWTNTEIAAAIDKYRNIELTHAHLFRMYSKMHVYEVINEAFILLYDFAKDLYVLDKTAEVLELD